MEADLINIFFQMVKIDSESGEEQKFLQFLNNLFEKKLNAHCEFDDYGNLIAHIFAKNSQGQSPILFCCHGDTIKPGKTIQPILSNGIIRSKGKTILGADDKAAIAEILVAIWNASQHPPIEIVITRREEEGLLGSKNLDINFLKAKAGYVLDYKTLKDIIVGGPSLMKINIKIIGKAAHAVEPQNGISAIEVAAHAICSLKTGWIDKETTVNIGIIQGGEVINAIPEQTTIQIECRSQNHEKCVTQSNIIKNTFENVAHAQNARTEVNMDLELNAYHIPEDAKVVKIAKRAIHNIGMKPRVKIICGGNDASNLNRRGIQTAVLGTGSKLPHSKDEHIAVKHMLKAVKILQEIFKEWK
jgi:tripeptide aminopeptidase